jgi:hypothetical protein
MRGNPGAQKRLSEQALADLKAEKALDDFLSGRRELPSRRLSNRPDFDPSFGQRGYLLEDNLPSPRHVLGSVDGNVDPMLVNSIPVPGNRS